LNFESASARDALNGAPILSGGCRRKAIEPLERLELAAA